MSPPATPTSADTIELRVEVRHGDSFRLALDTQLPGHGVNADKPDTSS